MTLEYKTPEQIGDQYLTFLKGLKPEVNIAQTDSDWWVRSRVVGGVVAGLYADQRKVADDIFPQSARREALERHLETYFGSGFTSATQAVGNLQVTGATGSTLPIGTQFEYTPNGNLYTATETIAFGTAASALIPVISVVTGQNQNLLEGASLTLPSPPAGVDSTATVFGGNISDGRNEETNEEAADRVLRQIRTPLAGGKVADYQTFALDADESVTSAKVIRYPFGFGTVGIVITAGTTDIDEALDNNLPIVVIPSEDLIETVQAYIDTQRPVTDCATVLSPASAGIDVTVNVRYVSGDNSTIPAGQTLTQEELVQREVKRAIYKTPPGGFQLGASGYVVASQIEEVLDLGLGANPYTVGTYAEILLDRQVEDLSPSGVNRAILPSEIAVPQNIIVVPM